MPWKFTLKSSPPPAAIHAVSGSAALALAAAFYMGLYAPQRQEIADLTERAERVGALAARGEAVSSEHRRLVERLDQLTSVARRTRSRMPAEPSGGEFVEQATRLAVELGLTVEQFQTGPPQDHGDVATIDVSCRVAGSYASICRFLAAIDQLSQLSSVSRLELRRAPDPQAYPLQVTFQLYYQLDPHDKDQQGGIL
jgi:Tfp pilus assembly protein PilO